MSDNNSEPFATTGSGKSEAEVAFELVSKLKGQGVWGERNMQAILDMYAECLDAVKGLRTYEGQKRVYAVIKMGGAQNTPQPVPVQPPVVAAAPVQPIAAQLPQAAPPPAPRPVSPEPQPYQPQPYTQNQS